MIRVFFLVFLSLISITNQFEIPEIRVIVVSNGIPSDGQIRVLRSANARNYTTNLVISDKPNEELTEILKYLNANKTKENEIVFLTPSYTMLFTQEAMILALKISQVALMGGGSVVMPHPAVNTTDIPTKYDEELYDLEDLLEAQYKFVDNSPRPDTFEEWKASLKPYAKLKYLQVKVKQEQRKHANINDERFCAITGLRIAVKESLRKYLEDPLSKDAGSLNSFCKNVMASGALRYELNVVLDSHARVFSLASAVSEDPSNDLGYSAGHDGSVNLHSPNVEIPPVLLDTPDKMPFLFPNMAAGEVGPITRPCEICMNNHLEDLVKIFGSIENFPIVHIIVPKSEDILGLDEFLENIMELAYPKNKTMLTLVMTYKDESTSFVKKTIAKQNEVLGKIYLKTAVVTGPEVEPLNVFEKMWDMAKTVPSHYTFIVDPTTRFTDKETIEHLIQANRQMVSPLLNLSEDEYSVIFERVGKDVKAHLLAGSFVAKTAPEKFNYLGVLEVPLSFGAVLIRTDVINRLEVPFKICKYDCEEDDLDCKARNEENVKNKCKVSYYKGIGGQDQSLWGMMFKQIQEQGILPYVSNMHEYGNVLI